jgi:trk system potassium uptake protein TrkH
MHFAIIFKVLGILLMLFSLTMVPPLLVSLWFRDGGHLSFLLAFVITIITGVALWLPTHNVRQDLRTRDGFLVTSLFWSVLGTFGSLPLVFSTATELSFTDALFESISGLTTTGATVLTAIDYLPESLLYYRQQIQWLGGIGIVVIAVAILPMLRIGGMQLYRAETPGPVKDTKLTPRITETAKALFLVYVLLTIGCAAAYWLAGMSLFDAVGHAFSTTANGGFSTHDASLGYFNSPAVLIIAMVFMTLAGANFALHFIAWQNRSLYSYWRDPEFRFYVTLLVIGCGITSFYLWYSDTYSFLQGLLLGSFEVISILTTAGFGAADFSVWPAFLPIFVLLSGFMGGCASSTAGGIKMVRILLILKQGSREMQRLVHPNAIIPIKIGNTTVSDRVVEAVWGFVAVYVLSFLALCILLMATGLDFITAFTAVGACINNIGPGLGEVAANFSSISAPAKWLLCFAMLLGRLEVFTLLVLFTPAFWQR